MVKALKNSTMFGWCIFACIWSSVRNFSSIFFCSTFALTTLRANISAVRFDLPSKHTAKPPFPSFLPIEYVSGDDPGSVMLAGGRHLSSIRSGFEGFSSGLAFSSGRGFFIAFGSGGGCIGRLTGRGERTSMSGRDLWSLRMEEGDECSDVSYGVCSSTLVRC